MGQLYEKALRETGEEEAAILEIHQMLLEDEDFQDAVNERLAEGCSAEYAVRQAGEDIAQMFSEMDDNMKARAARYSRRGLPDWCGYCLEPETWN